LYNSFSKAVEIIGMRSRGATGNFFVRNCMGSRGPPGIFSPPWTIFSLLALGSNCYYLNKIIAKMLLSSIEAYNYQQISKVFKLNFILKHA